MYEFLLILHSWLRWVVLLGGLAAVALAIRGLTTGVAYDKPQRIAGVVFMASIHTMLILGLALMVVSPTVQAAFGDFGAAMKDKLLRFWTVEHPLTMILSVVAVTVGHIASKKAEGQAAHRRALIGFGLGFLFILARFPWPWAEQIGRAWFRL